MTLRRSKNLLSTLRTLVLLALLGPTLALACLPPTPESWKKTSPDGRYALSLEAAPDAPRGPFPLTLRDVRAGKEVWRRTLDTFRPAEDVLLASSGLVVEASPFDSAVFAYGLEGTEVGRWDLPTLLTPAQARGLPRTSCGTQWLSRRAFEGDVLVLELPTGGVRPPIYAQPQGTVLRINTRNGQLTREDPPPPPSTAQLLQSWKSQTGARERQALVEQLLTRSEEAGVGGSAELSRFWRELLTASATPGPLLKSAVQGLQLTATDEELRQVAKLPAGPPERNLELLTVLERRLPAEAPAYALRALSGKWPPELLRERALIYLATHVGDETEPGFQLALKDPSPRVRRSVLYALSQWPVGATTVERVLPASQDPDAEVRQQAAESLRRMLRDVDETMRPYVLDVLRDTGKAGKLKGFPEGWIVLAGAADLQSERARALELYARGLKELEALEPARREQSRDLELEARLQLAFEAKKQGQRQEVERHARKVLADERNQLEMVCAPKPSAYAGGKGCQARLAATDVARKLLEEPGR